LVLFWKYQQHLCCRYSNIEKIVEEAFAILISEEVTNTNRGSEFSLEIIDGFSHGKVIYLQKGVLQALTEYRKNIN